MEIKVNIDDEYARCFQEDANKLNTSLEGYLSKLLESIGRFIKEVMRGASLDESLSLVMRDMVMYYEKPELLPNIPKFLSSIGIKPPEIKPSGVNIGTRVIWADAEPLAEVEEFSFHVAGIPPEDAEKLQGAKEIRLVRKE